jgi:hypothetical protein
MTQKGERLRATATVVSFALRADLTQWIRPDVGRQSQMLALVSAGARSFPARMCWIDERVSANFDARTVAGVCGSAVR